MPNQRAARGLRVIRKSFSLIQSSFQKLLNGDSVTEIEI